MLHEWSLRRFTGSTKEYALSFFRQSGIHGFGYFANLLLTIFEKYSVGIVGISNPLYNKYLHNRLLWLIIIIASFGVLVMLSLQSIHRYRFSSTVVTIERDHYYWNITLPSVTICPLSERLNRTLFEDFVRLKYSHLSKEDAEDLFIFLESLANSSYSNFKNIKPTPVFDVYAYTLFLSMCLCSFLYVLCYILKQKLNIPASDYMSLIYNLTQDWSRREGGSINEYKVRTMLDREFVYTEQILTEFGICYGANNHLLQNVSASWQVLHKTPPPLRFDRFYDNKKTHRIVASNQFDGEVSYTNKGYNVGYIRVFVHSPYDVMNSARKGYVTDQLISFYCMGIMIIADEEFKE